MLQLRTLGGLAILRDGLPHERVSTHRKRLILLAVLATAGETGIAREKLLALFWPESDTERARANLKQAVFALRREVGTADLIAGSSELRLNRSVIESDLAAFQHAIEAGDVHAAVDTYAGEFLDGVRIGGEAELERWIERQRARLNREFRIALQALTKDAATSADLAFVRSKWERLVVDHAADTTAAHALVTVLLRLGDVEAARRAARVHDVVVTEEQGAAPQAPLAAFVEEAAAKIRRISPASIDAVTVVPTPPGTGRRRLAAVVAAGIVIVVVAAGVAGMAARLERAPATALSLAINDSSTDPIARPVDDMERSTVERALQVHLLGHGARFRLAERVVRSGDAIHVLAELHDVTGHESRLEVDGPATDAALLGAQLGTEVVGRMLGASSAALADAAMQSTRSIPALLEFVTGESNYRAARFAVAADAFQRAVAHDSAFAVGWYRLSVTCDWAARTDCSFDASRRAAAFADRLDEHTRLLLDGLRAWHASDRGAAERIYSYVTEHYPDDAEAWYQLGDERFHLGPFAGLPIDLARGPFERAVRLDSSGPEAFIHLARIAALRKDLRGADTLYAKAIARSDETGRKELLVMRAFSVHDTVAARAFLGRQAQRESDQFLWLVAERLASYAGNLEASESVFRILTERSRPLATRSAAHTELGVLAIAHGRFVAADSEFQIAGSFSAPARAAVYAFERRRLLRLLPDLPVSELPALRPRAVADTAHVESPTQEYAAPDLRDAAEARYGELPAMVDAFLGAAEGHMRDTLVLEHIQRAAGPRADSARALLAAARAAQAFRSGQWGAVERNLDLRLTTPLWLPLMPIERYWHAIALEKEGHLAQALQWLRSFEAVAPEQRTMEPRAHLESARLLLAIGDTARARSEYTRTLVLWKNGDAVLRSIIADLTPLSRRAQAPPGGEKPGRLSSELMAALQRGLRLVLDM